VAQLQSWNTEINDGTYSHHLSFRFHYLAGPSCQIRPNQTDTDPSDIDCTNLWLDYYVCVHVPGATTTTQPPKPTEPSGRTPQCLALSTTARPST
jgi:hypothetical protein